MTDHAAIEAFLFREGALLDARAYEEWLALFTRECCYWVPLEEGQVDPKLTVSLIYDDRKLLETRIRRLMHPRMHAQAPHSRTLHVIGNVVILDKQKDGHIPVRSNQMIIEYRQNHQRVYAGHCLHELVEADGGYQIALKRIDLIDSEGDHRGISIIL